jgi:predicted aspartyl protease
VPTEPSEKIQRHNLFHIFLIVNNCRVIAIIDGGSCNNLVSLDLARHNLFHIFLIINNCRVITIIDGGSCNNLVNSDLVKKLGLTTNALSQPYEIQ